jgi:oxygen-independent coproporphyrinogen-3 oxidase
VASGQVPVAGHEVLTRGQRRLERVMLELRLADGLPLGALEDPVAAHAAAADGLLELTGARAVLTRRGRRLADGVVRALA